MDDLNSNFIYPYSRKKLARQLRSRDVLSEKELYYAKQASEYIPKALKEGLDEMELYGYDFWYSSSWKLWNKVEGIKFKKMQRQCYMKMKCVKCME